MMVMNRATVGRTGRTIVRMVGMVVVRRMQYITSVQ